MPANTVYMKAGDKDDLVVRLYDANRNVLVLPDNTTAVFKMRNAATGSVVVTNGAVVVDAANGKLTHSWGATTGTAGKYEGHFILTPPSGKVQTVPKYGFVEIIISATF